MTVRETGPACGRAGSCFFLPLFTEFIVFFLDGRCNARHCLDHQGIEKAGWFINANRPALLIHWDSVLINRQNSCCPDLWNVRQPSASSHEHSGAPSSGTLINQAWTTGRAEFGQLTRSEMRHWKRSVTPCTFRSQYPRRPHSAPLYLLRSWSFRLCSPFRREHPA